MKELKSINRTKYRAALEDIKLVNELGLEVKFRSVIKKYELHPATKASLVPNLKGVDLDQEFDGLYISQAAFLRQVIERSQYNNREVYRDRKHRIAVLEEENARLRAKLSKKSK